MKEIVLHGICIGSATLVYAVTDPSCPSYVKSLTADGLYKDFKSKSKEQRNEGMETLSSYILQYIFQIFQLMERPLQLNA